MMLWHEEHAGFARCAVWRSRTDGSFSPVVFSLVVFASFNGGTFAGGDGGGVPRRTSRIHFPRTTGEVRVAIEVSVNTLAWPNRPRRLSSLISTRRNRFPTTFGIP